MPQDKQMSAWMDLRNHGYFRVGTYSPVIQLGNPKNNAQEHFLLLEHLYTGGAQLAVGPECGMTGYTIWDLVNQEVIMNRTEEAVEWLLEKTADMHMLIVIGAYMDVDSSRYNVAIVMLQGKILAIIPKSYLASSGEFRDERWVTSGLDVSDQLVDYAGQEDIPFGTDILIKSRNIRNFILSIQVCQDLWVPIPPSTIASLNGATVSATINASPEIVGKEEYQQALVNFYSANTYTAMIYASSGVGESSTDLVFGGRMCVAQNNRTLLSVDRFDEGSPKTALVDIDLRAVVVDRRNDPSFQLSAKRYKQKYRVITFREGLGQIEDVSVYYHLQNHKLDKQPFVPSHPWTRNKYAQRIMDMQVAAFERRLLALPEGNRRPVVAISGGSDSALALMVAAFTMDKMGLPRSDIIAITMPGFGTTPTTYQLAVDLIQSVGATFKEVDITHLTTEALLAVGHDGQSEDLTFENAQALIRKLVEWLNANYYHGIVLGTGDLSELIMGWTTYAGDHMSHYNPNANLAKTTIWFMLELLSRKCRREDPYLADALMSIRQLPPTPELLRPNKDGSFSQISESKVGEYIFQDFNIFHMLRWGDSPWRIARKMYEAYDHNLNLADIVCWLRTLMQRFLPSQFKRSTSPDGVLVGTVGVSPRDKLKIPSDADRTIWLEDVERIPIEA